MMIIFKLSILLVFAFFWPSYEAKGLNLSLGLHKPSQAINPSDFGKAGYLPGIDIQGEDRLQIFEVSAPDHCQIECLNQKDNCHAWTFLDQNCFLISCAGCRPPTNNGGSVGIEYTTGPSVIETVCYDFRNGRWWPVPCKK